MVLSFKGISALSDSKRQNLLKVLQAVHPTITSVDGEYVHFVEISKKLTPTQTILLENLLNYDSPFDGKRNGKVLVSVPRLGTLSPWSSKATDIVNNTGLCGTVRRLERGTIFYIQKKGSLDLPAIVTKLHDRMTHSLMGDINQAALLFKSQRPRRLKEVDLGGGIDALFKANKNLGMALSDEEVKYLHECYSRLKRNPSDAELMMFALVNSEHCRHKIFNASWTLDGQQQPKTLFQMIKNTYNSDDKSILSAYSDNAAVLRGPLSDTFLPGKDKVYAYQQESTYLVIKVETHNHPTAIAPAPGAATGVGGEIRDEAAAGRGAKSKMGLVGFSVSNLNLPGAKRPWEKNYAKPVHMASALRIMSEGPIGGAAYANEFGRPNLAGYFRTYEQSDNAGNVWGYHKPIMVVGGLGNIRQPNIYKRPVKPGYQLVVLGGPAMLIGLAGGAASSMQSGDSDASLDFASVQRANAEMERRTQEVINTCLQLGRQNPIASIHDVGAGGLANALPELVHADQLGAAIELRKIPSADPGLSPMEIWCNESQERYVLAIEPKKYEFFEKICRRERCPYAAVGKATAKNILLVHDAHFSNDAVNIPMPLLFGGPPKTKKDIRSTTAAHQIFSGSDIKLPDAVERVLKLPAVSSKKFLITIGDRTVGGLVTRDQMVGPWQVPVSDVAVSASSFGSTTGEAMAMGEHTPLAIIDGPASGRMAVGEAITNIAAARIKKLSDIKLSANWMAASGIESEDVNLFKTVEAIGEYFCPKLGVTIPVGKDSLSMRTLWQEDGKSRSVTSPVSLIISAFAPVLDCTKTLTPLLKKVDGTLILIDLGAAKNRLGGSALAQVFNQIGGEAPDIEATKLKAFFDSVQKLNAQGLLLAYHDRSDGGLLATLCEMSFASRCGLDIQLKDLPGDPLAKLFTEELGAVIQVPKKSALEVVKLLSSNLGGGAYIIGEPTNNQMLNFKDGPKTVYKNSRSNLEKWWADTSFRIQSLRDNSITARQEHSLIGSETDTGLFSSYSFSLARPRNLKRPRIAILREQGVNGHIEMAAAFDRVGCKAVDVHMQDLLDGQTNLKLYKGIVTCGGFSYGDVLGAGEGWAKTVLFNQSLNDQFRDFFNRDNSFSLGVCNGCQMLSALKELIPGAEHWPRFLKNKSEQFEARLVMVKINDSPSLLFRDMAGSYLPLPVSHGEGRAEFSNVAAKERAIKDKLVVAQYVDNNSQVTEKYPYNPNGSVSGIAALTSTNGRATILMPHPERAFLSQQFSWRPAEWGKDSPWLKIFQNASDF